MLARLKHTCGGGSNPPRGFNSKQAYTKEVLTMYKIGSEDFTTLDFQKKSNIERCWLIKNLNLARKDKKECYEVMGLYRPKNGKGGWCVMFNGTLAEARKYMKECCTVK